MVRRYRLVCPGSVRTKVREYVYFKVFTGKGNGSRGDRAHEHVDWRVSLNGASLICWANRCVIGDHNYVVCKSSTTIAACLSCRDSMRLVSPTTTIGVSSSAS